MADQITTVSKERVIELMGLLPVHDRHVAETWTSRLWQQTAEQGCYALRSATPKQVCVVVFDAEFTSTVGMPDRCAHRVPSPLRGKGQTGQRAGSSRPAR